jgi:hypothetical protein
LFAWYFVIATRKVTNIESWYQVGVIAVISEPLGLACGRNKEKFGDEK